MLLLDQLHKCGMDERLSYPIPVMLADLKHINFAIGKTKTAKQKQLGREVMELRSRWGKWGEADLLVWRSLGILDVA